MYVLHISNDGYFLSHVFGVENANSLVSYCSTFLLCKYVHTEGRNENLSSISGEGRTFCPLLPKQSHEADVPNYGII